MKKNIIKAQCSSCGGTGLYEGMCERKGEPVMCLSCNGTGCEFIHFVPYTGRKLRRGVKCVRFKSTKLFIENPSTESVSYKEFLAKIKEPK